MQMSHLDPRRVLLKKKSRGFHAVSAARLRVGDAVPLRGSIPMLVRLPPGLMRVKRWTSGTTCEERMVVEPSVAAAMDIAEPPSAVWKESIVMIESFGVGACGPVARGRVVRSSDRFGACAGRIVSMEDSED